ncbi:MYCBP-associated protein [Fundulus heteroclitus]|uniref:MYCBP-associated protein n=1 Tax=Fundulus heteroclitus TaxID=8078 RepID=UPI00165A9C22|nr:MYCBP-associated protein [Fundulus heteroclitus]XP_035993175.1 MYCBP-associated protein [Fundulus heteroclitus]XP_035993176.1 MYCBP-associated protein [Fundulus heteroclitus]XP_035993177.1 MYCBP-associated protein [Fundulus heteroclitus]
MLEELSGVVHPDTTNTAGDNWAPRPQSDEKLYKPKPPQRHQSPEMAAKVHERSPPEEDRNAAEVAPMEDSQQLDFTAYLRFDERGMVLPHSILGSLEDFHSYLEARGEKNLLKQIPEPVRGSASGARRGPRRDTAEGGPAQIPLKVSHQRSSQTNALQRWDAHMTNRRQKQEELSYSLNRPVENLVMNQAKHFRDTQERREILSRVIPLTHSGYGYGVGCEFWSLPQRIGDELSGITATLTQTERGQQNPNTYVGHPSSIQMEMGTISTGAESTASWAWGQSAYLQHRSQELQDILEDMGIRKPDISKLEVIGTAGPLTSSPEHQSLLLQKEKEEKHDEMKTEKLDTPAQTDYDQLKALPFPALRIHGQLATWTGDPTSDKGEVGISTSVFFESQTGEIVSTDLELHNEGSTVIFYRWHKPPVPQCFSYLSSPNTSVYFYFKSASGVIRPGETQRVEFIFKSEEPGLWTELWQLRTHPPLLQGASIQVRLSGKAFKQDKTADQRCFLENKLEKAVVEKLCRSIMVEVVGRLHTPERPNSPAELYITEEQLFQNTNPKLQYHYQPVEDLKTLWHQVNPGASWDFSVDTLRQAVLSLPDAEPVKEESFSQLNSLYLQLSEPADVQHHLLTPQIIGRQLWIKLLDLMGDEATRLRDVMGLPDKETWADVATPSPTDEKVQNKREEKSGSLLEESKIKGRKKDDAGKRSREKQGKDSDSLADFGLESTMEIQSVHPETILTYTRTLHKKVYTWMEDLVDNLCDLMEDVHVGDGGHNTNCCA